MTHTHTHREKEEETANKKDSDRNKNESSPQTHCLFFSNLINHSPKNERKKERFIQKKNLI